MTPRLLTWARAPGNNLHSWGALHGPRARLKAAHTVKADATKRALEVELHVARDSLISRCLSAKRRNGITTKEISDLRLDACAFIACGRMSSGAASKSSALPPSAANPIGRNCATLRLDAKWGMRVERLICQTRGTIMFPKSALHPIMAFARSAMHRGPRACNNSASMRAGRQTTHRP